MLEIQEADADNLHQIARFGPVFLSRWWNICTVEVFPDPSQISNVPRHSTKKTAPFKLAPPQLTNIVKTAIRIAAGRGAGEVSRAALVIGVSDPTIYRWRRAGNMRPARGAECCGCTS